MGLVPYKRDTREIPCSLDQVRTQREDADYEEGSRTSPEGDCWFLDLGLPSLQNCAQ